MATFRRGTFLNRTTAHNSRLFKRLADEPPQPVPDLRDLSEAFTRDKIILQLISRDGDRCYLCQTTQHPLDYEIDHIIPKAHGGTDQLRNFGLACQSCNRRKYDYIVSIRIADRMPCYTFADTSRFRFVA